MCTQLPTYHIQKDKVAAQARLQLPFILWFWLLFISHSPSHNLRLRLSNSSTCGTEVQVDSVAEVTSKDSEKELVFSHDEEILIARMFNLVGERWPLIAGRIPGRNAEEIEKYWNSTYSTSQ
ncbi:unnamed protein product [Cuscuta europaea]|uniref:Myb-like domain-containing protein n=1 Tax=Cuscuta europaea TaxID=41803 RepID=A0A9P1ELU7_CUSEU|nr:unnamed protein product [Cuscuta europaea]